MALYRPLREEEPLGDLPVRIRSATSRSTSSSRRVILAARSDSGTAAIPRSHRSTIEAKGINMSKRSFAPKDGPSDEPSVFVVGQALRLEGRSHDSVRLWWEASEGCRRADDGPSWTVPPLWEAPFAAQAEVKTARATLRGFPAYKRTWQQLALF